MPWFLIYDIAWASLVAQTLKNLPAMQGTQPQSLGWEDPLKQEMVTHSSIIAWRIPWTKEPSRLQSMGLQRVGHNQVTNTCIFIAELQNRPPRDISTWYVDYFKLKAMETLRFREITALLNYLEEFVGFSFSPQNRIITSEKFYLNDSICMAEQTSNYPISVLFMVLWMTLMSLRISDPYPIL